ncbi:MAG TPA: UDP-phosphate galactose phosphotransferase, partial [Gammaproteobacteria bacterium]|nr:UDP-phosphate galactose phosphotransferase [Gammaproteobacteria bacterium]
MDSIRIFKHYVRIPFILLGISEFIVMFLSVSASAYLVLQQDKYQFSEYFDSSLVSALIYAFIMSLSMIAIGLYQARLREGILGFLLRLSAALFLGTVVLSLVFYIFPSLFLGRGVLLLAELISFAGIALIRNIIYFSGSDIFKKRILVLGAGERAASITELRRKSDQVGFTIVGYVHVRGEKNVIDPKRVIHLNSSLLGYCVDNNIDEIVLAINDRRKTFPMSELLDCKMSGVDIVDILQFFERETSKIKLDHLHPSYLLFSDGFQQGIARQNIKRLFDVVISGVFLLLTWPIMAMTALAILLESGFGQPILYRQVRVGEDGKPFQVLKFRSMRTDA